MVLLVLKSHGALYLCGRVYKPAQGVARQRVVVASRVHVFKAVRLVVFLLGVHPAENKAFNLVGCVEGVAVFGMVVGGKLLQHAAQITRVWSAILVDHFTEDQYLAGTAYV